MENTDVTLRLVDPTVFRAGRALCSMAICAFLVAWKRRVPQLYLAVFGLLIVAIPRLATGTIDLLVLFDHVRSDTYAPAIFAYIGGLQGYAFLLIAISVIWCTSRVLKRHA